MSAMKFITFAILLAAIVGSLAFIILSQVEQYESDAHVGLVYNTQSTQTKEDQVFEQDIAVNISKNNTIPKKDKEILFVGDIMLSRGIGKIMEDAGDWGYPFRKISSELLTADLVFGNLESVISDQGRDLGNLYSFRADERALEGLSAANISIVSVANNHVWDYGKAAYLDTLHNLNKHKISFTGGGTTFEQAHWPTLKQVGDTSIAFLAYTNLIPRNLTTVDSRPSIAYIEKEQLRKDITRAKEFGDVVVVSFHWGEEYKTFHNRYQESMAHLSVDFGADLVVGHHPHVVQDVEKYKGGFIAYSLGNFIFDQNFNDVTSTGLMLRVNIRDKKIYDIKKIPIAFTDTFQPYVID
tara:strand:- start:229 stop:1290 length:1062 start_codon:yes stop_codon:yes gene_type:complete